MNKEGRRIIQAFKLKAAVTRLKRAKINSIRAQKGLPPLKSWYENWMIVVMEFIKQALLRVCCPCVLPKGNKKTNKLCCCKSTSCFAKTFTGGTYNNDILRSFLWFFAGIAMSFGIYVLIALSLQISLRICVTIAIIVSFILCIGLAFSDCLRCIMLLVLPNFFTSQGRSFLLMYATVLVLIYPVTNFSNNILVMSESATCGQGMALNETKELVKTAVSPLASVADGLREMLRAIAKFAKSIKRAFVAMKNAIQEICSAIGRVFKWLASITDICNERMGEPYQKCMKAFDDASKDCQDVLGFFDFLCSIVDVVSYVCNVARIGELLCIVVEAVTNFVSDEIGAPIKAAIHDVEKMFYFNVSLDYHYNLTMIQSKSYADVKRDILNDVKKRLKFIDKAIVGAEVIMMFTFLLVFVKAINYRRKYLTQDKFDNTYITETIKYINNRRKLKGLPTILPLKRREKWKYIGTFSPLLTGCEQKKLLKGLLFLIFNLINASFYITCDYGLYWILLLIRKQLQIKTTAPVPAHVKVHVQGEGSMSDMYRSMMGVLDPVSGKNLNVDTTPCLPNPGVPNFRIYKIVGGIMIGCIITTIFEAYGLRLRHIIAGCYYGKRDQARAVYLYNKILKLRGRLVFKVARMAKQKYQGEESSENTSLRARLSIQFPIIGKLMKYLGYKRKACLNCAIEGRENDYENFHHCEGPGCKAIYCLDCFVDLNNICNVCMNILEYGEDSDFEEEIDSSEDELHILAMREKARERKKKIAEIREGNKLSNTILEFRKLAGISADATASEIIEMDKKAPSIDSDASSLSSFGKPVKSKPKSPSSHIIEMGKKAPSIDSDASSLSSFGKPVKSKPKSPSSHIIEMDKKASSIDSDASSLSSFGKPVKSKPKSPSSSSLSSTSLSSID